jgi:hypothetical protein
MNRQSTFHRCLMAFETAFFVLALNTASMAQVQSAAGLSEFKISIERTDNGLKLHSFNGTAWIDLSFRLANGQPQLIDEYGMTEAGNTSAHKDPALADFLFTITKTKNGMILTGIEGTAWKELSCSLPKNGSVVITQLGMTQ